MARFYKYMTIKGSQTNIFNQNLGYTNPPANGTTWNYTGEVREREFLERLNNAVDFNGDETNETTAGSGQDQTLSEEFRYSDLTIDPNVVYDFSMSVTDGTTTWSFGVIDADLNDDGDVGDENEDGYILVFRDGVPPADTDLTISNRIFDNVNTISHADLGGALADTTWISIGNFIDIDGDGENDASEATNDAALIGTKFDHNDMELKTVTENSEVLEGSNNKLLMETSRASRTAPGDTVTVDGVTSELDAIYVYNATVTRGDGSEVDQIVRVVQLNNGETYIVDGGRNGAQSARLDSTEIRSITINSRGGSGFGRYVNSRSVEGSRIACFTAGTSIATPDGIRAIETLRAGDLVLTRDHGPQPLRWIGQRSLEKTDFDANPQLRPIRISAGALGSDLPKIDLVVSRQHRILLQSKVAERMFETSEVLTAAKNLLGAPGVCIDTTCNDVTYVHILFDAHEVVLANGAYAETLFVGKEAWRSFEEDAKKELRTLFPELSDEAIRPMDFARTVIHGAKTRTLLARHRKNDIQLFAAE